MSQPSQVPPPNKQLNRPHLTLTPSLHPSTLSLSSPTLLTTSLTLTLSIHLSNSDSPITVYTGDCFLSSRAQNFYQSDYRLSPLSTGTPCPAHVTHAYRAELIRFDDPHAALLEIQPGEVAVREVKIGIVEEPKQPSPLSSQQLRSDDDDSTNTNLASLALCATQLSWLTAGQEYQVQLAHKDDGWPNHVWWSMLGVKEEIIRDVGKKGRDGLIKANIKGKDVWGAWLQAGLRSSLEVEMREGAVLKVVN